MKLIDITGATFGRLTVVGRGQNVAGRASWRVICACGNATTVMGKDLRRGHTQSCGCLQKERSAEASRARIRARAPAKKHPLHATWKHMKRRCSSPLSPDYRLYGARGIRVCERWRSFRAFVDDMGPRPDGASLDRIDPDGNYEPGNCRWATPAQQAQNRSCSRLPRELRCAPLTFGGETMDWKEWAARLGLHPSAISQRLRKGWDVERAFTTPKIGARP